MLLASLLVPIAVLAIVLLVQRLHLPAFLAIMATVVVYGIAADMQFQSVGDSFGLGFASAIEQVGLLVVDSVKTIAQTFNFVFFDFFHGGLIY